MQILNPELLNPFFFLLGKAVFYVFLLVFSGAVLIAVMIGYSFYTEHFIFPNFMLAGIDLLEDVIKALFRGFRIEENIVDDMGIELRNKVNLGKFRETPVNTRAIFLPQCLRHIECPAKLSSEGIQCVNCGRCEVGEAKERAEEYGYMVFIVPGSSFIERMIQKYMPKAIIGVGCQFEIKSGLEMCQKNGLPGQGLVLSKSGCVSTELDWDSYYQLIGEGLEPE